MHHGHARHHRHHHGGHHGLGHHYGLIGLMLRFPWAIIVIGLYLIHQ